MKDVIFSANKPDKKEEKPLRPLWNNYSWSAQCRRPLIDLTQYEVITGGDIVQKEDEFYSHCGDDWFSATRIGSPAGTLIYRRRRNIR